MLHVASDSRNVFSRYENFVTNRIFFIPILSLKKRDSNVNAMSVYVGLY